MRVRGQGLAKKASTMSGSRPRCAPDSSAARGPCRWPGRGCPPRFRWRRRPQVEAVAHHVALHAQVIGQGHVPRAAQLLQRHVQHQRRALAQQRRGLRRPRRRIRLQRAHDVGDAGQPKKRSISARRLEAAAGGPCRRRSVSRTDSKRSPSASLPTRWELRRRARRRPARRRRIGAADQLSGQREVFAQRARAARQEPAAADVREQADVGLRHRHLRALGGDAQAGVAPWAEMPMPPPITMPSMKTT